MKVKKLINKGVFTKYHPGLIEHLYKSILQVSIILHIVVPMVFIALTYKFIPIIHIIIWFILNIIVFTIRLYIRKNMSFFIKNKEYFNLNKCLNSYIYIVIVTSFLLLSYTYESLIFNVPSHNLTIIILIIVAVSAGAVTSLGTIFSAYLLFISINLLSLAAILLYVDYQIYYLSSLSLSLLCFSLIILGYRNFDTLANAIYLQETFETIYNKTTDGIALIKNTYFNDCNESIINMFGYKSKKDFLNTHIQKFMPTVQPDGQNSIKKMLKMLKIAETNNNNSFEWLHIKKDGSEFWTEIVLTKIYLNGEYLTHGIWRDISQRKELEYIKDKSKKEIERLNESLEEKVNNIVNDLRKKDKILYEQSKLVSMGEMIGNIAHQWRQPLSVISTLATGTKLNQELNIVNEDKLLKNMDIINENAQYLSRTIDDFRNFIKKDAKLTTFDINENISKFLNLTISSIKHNNITIILDIPEKINIDGHPNELIQCFLNIFNNAKDALTELKETHRYIFISSKKIEDKVIIVFKDNAGGIPINIISKIFEPYFTTKHQSQGTGIGLNMTYQIITKMEGSISSSNETFIYNDITYTGAVFTITLPLS